MARPARPGLTFVGVGNANIDGQAVSYTVKRSPRARYVRLEVRPENGLTVVIPRSYKPDQVPNLLGRKRRWVLSKLAKCGHPRPSVAGKALGSDDTILYLGLDARVVLRQSSQNNHSVILEGGRLIVDPRAARTGGLEWLVEQWYRMRAAALIREKADELSTQLEVAYSRLTIRGQRTRWGSCSRQGNLSFNWKLIAAPEPVVDYVVVHELTHLKEMNHSWRFWQLVAKHCPRWREHKKWLGDHAGLLGSELPVS